MFRLATCISQISVVNVLPIAGGLKSSLVDQLQTVLADLQANNTAQTCSDLTSYISHVNAQSGEGLTTTQANQLLTAANRIRRCCPARTTDQGSVPFQLPPLQQWEAAEGGWRPSL